VSLASVVASVVASAGSMKAGLGIEHAHSAAPASHDHDHRHEPIFKMVARRGAAVPTPCARERGRAPTKRALSTMPSRDRERRGARAREAGWRDVTSRPREA
jgi:hypothetical protein